MKWIRLLVIGSALILTGLFAVPASAETSDMVLIKCTGYVCEAPGGFTITYLSDYELGLSWVKGADAVNTMVRVKDGSMPASRTDGNLVYYGEGTYASDTGVNFEEATGTKYYRAWSQNANGVWEEAGASSFMENPYMLLAVLAGVSLGLMMTAYFARRKAPAFLAGGAWMAMSAYCYTRVVSEWDIYYILFWLSAGFAVMSVFEVFVLRERKEEGEEPEEDEEEAAFREETEEMEKESKRYAFLFKRKRTPRKRITRFERTGEL